MVTTPSAEAISTAPTGTLSASSAADAVDTDTRGPTLEVLTAKLIKDFTRDVEAYVAGTKKEDKCLCGPRVLCL